MTPDELTQIANIHQTVLSRHDQEMSAIRSILNEVAEQQKANTQAIAQLTAEQQLSRQDINSLTAGILSLQNLVADYLAGRTKPTSPGNDTTNTESNQ